MIQTVFITSKYNIMANYNTITGLLEEAAAIETTTAKKSITASRMGKMLAGILNYYKTNIASLITSADAAKKVANLDDPTTITKTIKRLDISSLSTTQITESVNLLNQNAQLIDSLDSALLAGDSGINVSPTGIVSFLTRYLRTGLSGPMFYNYSLRGITNRFNPANFNNDYLQSANGFPIVDGLNVNAVVGGVFSSIFVNNGCTMLVHFYDGGSLWIMQVDLFKPYCSDNIRKIKYKRIDLSLDYSGGFEPELRATLVCPDNKHLYIILQGGDGDINRLYLDVSYLCTSDEFDINSLTLIEQNKYISNIFSDYHQLADVHMSADGLYLYIFRWDSNGENLYVTVYQFGEKYKFSTLNPTPVESSGNIISLFPTHTPRRFFIDEDKGLLFGIASQANMLYVAPVTFKTSSVETISTPALVELDSSGIGSKEPLLLDTIDKSIVGGINELKKGVYKLTCYVPAGTEEYIEAFVNGEVGNRLPDLGGRNVYWKWRIMGTGFDNNNGSCSLVIRSEGHFFSRLDNSNEYNGDSNSDGNCSSDWSNWEDLSKDIIGLSDQKNNTFRFLFSAHQGNVTANLHYTIYVELWWDEKLAK
jgi:hypothetical protein